MRLKQKLKLKPAALTLATMLKLKNILDDRNETLLDQIELRS